MRVSSRLLSLFALATAFSSAAIAQGTAPATPAPSGPAPTVTATTTPAPATRKPLEIGFTGNLMSFNSTTAAQQNVSSHSFGMQLDAGLSFGKFLFAGVDVGPQFLSDKASFTQTTTAGDMSSTATLVYFSAMAGVRTPAVTMPGLPAMSLGLYGGGSGTSAKRSIEKCTGCLSQDITIPGGTFVQPTLVFGDGSTRVRVSDRYFTSGDGIRSLISAGMEFGGR